MSVWTSGYVAGIDYTHGFYRELTPTLLGFIALTRGQRGPSADAPLAYCELGCGQGFSTNLLAAANPHIQFYATDFNPAHIAGAQALAAAAGTGNVSFFDQSFDTFASEPSLPAAFDIIALHGIYSWISPDNRRHVVDFIRRKLRPGGLVYISYNTLPGWAAAMPLRHLIAEHAAAASGPIAPRIDAALAFAEALVAAKAGYFAQNPAVTPRLDKMKGMAKNYLAHEYFNRDWHPFYFADVAAEMGDAKLAYVGSAALLEGIDSINFTPDQQALLNATPDSVRQQGLRDVIVNRQFRRDVFARGSLAHTTLSVREAWADLRLALSARPGDIPMSITTSLGEAKLQPAIYAPILEALADGPRTVRQILSAPAQANVSWASLMQALMILVGTGHLHPCLSAKNESARARGTRAFNASLCKQAEASGDLLFLASPVTGGGIAVDRIQQLFLAARAANQDPASFVWRVLSAQGQKLLKDGQPLDSAEDNIAELRARHGDFLEKQLPVLVQLGIA